MQKPILRITQIEFFFETKLNAFYNSGYCVQQQRVHFTQSPKPVRIKLFTCSYVSPLYREMLRWLTQIFE